MIVGLTGGIACGKSTVSRMLAECGAAVVDADRIAREVVRPGMPALDEIREAFGSEVLTPEGELDRKRLGSIVFADPEARRRLEGITHPRIRAEMQRQMAEWNGNDPDKLVVADIPLLFESGLDKHYDFEEIIVVYIPRELQIERLTERDGISRADAERRLAAQWPIEEKRSRADVVIDNSGTLAETERQVKAYYASRSRSEAP